MRGETVNVLALFVLGLSYNPCCHQGIFLDTASTVGDSLRRDANGHRPLAANGPARGTSPRPHDVAPVLSPKDHGMETLDEIGIEPLNQQWHAMAILSYFIY